MTLKYIQYWCCFKGLVAMISNIYKKQKQSFGVEDINHLNYQREIKMYRFC